MSRHEERDAIRLQPDYVPFHIKNDPDAKEDYEKEEKFVPQPYRGTNKSPKKPVAKGKSAKKGTEKKSEKKTDLKPKAQGDSDEQMSLLGVA